MTKQQLDQIIEDIKQEANIRAGMDPETHFVLSAKAAIAVLEDVYKFKEEK